MWVTSWWRRRDGRGGRGGVGGVCGCAAGSDPHRSSRRADPALPIEVGPITLEFTVITRREGAGKAGVKFWVVDAGVSGKLGNESTQKVTILRQIG